MTRPLAPLLALTATLVSFGSATAQGLPDETRRLLERALDPDVSRSYVGTRVVQVRMGPERRQHTEYVTRRGPFIRIEFPKDSPFTGQVIVENGKTRRHYFPDRNEIRVTPPRRERALGRIERMTRGRDKNLKIQAFEAGGIAGHRAQGVVFLDPKGNVLQRIWIEPRSGVMLKREFYDRTGTVAGGFEFSQLNLNPKIDARDFNLSVRGAKVVTPRDDLKSIASKNGFPMLALPANHRFQLEGARLQNFGGRRTLMQQYSSATNRFSLFMTRDPINPERIGRNARGNFRSLAWSRDGMNFAIVGDLSERDLREVAKLLGNPS